MSTLAVVLALGGGVAYAANTVLSSDIVDGEVKTADIGNNQIRSVDLRNDTLSGGGLQSSDIAPGAITAADVAGESLTGDEVADESLTVSDITDESLTGDVVANDSMTGSDVIESSLGVVPDADRVDGRHVCPGRSVRRNFLHDPLRGGRADRRGRMHSGRRPARIGDCPAADDPGQQRVLRDQRTGQLKRRELP